MTCHIYILVSGKNVLESAKWFPSDHGEILTGLGKRLDNHECTGVLDHWERITQLFHDLSLIILQKKVMQISPPLQQLLGNFVLDHWSKTWSNPGPNLVFARFLNSYVCECCVKNLLHCVIILILQTFREIMLDFQNKMGSLKPHVKPLHTNLG